MLRGIGYPQREEDSEVLQMSPSDEGLEVLLIE
jgi:hypothetical protein